MSPSASLAQKQAYLARVLEAWTDRLQEVASPAPGERLGYRDRVTLTVRWSDPAGWRFGLVRRDELIAIHDCPVHTPRIRRLVHALARSLPSGEELPLAYLHVAGAQATLIVKARGVAVEVLRPAVEAAADTGIEGLWLHEHPSAGRRLFARSGWSLLWGEGESIGPGGLVHGPTAFLQALPGLHAAAVRAALDLLRPDEATAVLDLYCGLGSTLAAWRRAGAITLGVELSGEAVSFASRNAPGTVVLRGTCVQRLPQVLDWWRRQPPRRLAYVNPPRSGLEPELIDALVGPLRPERIAYLSCSAGTLARDLRALGVSGYAVRTILPFDFFPMTHHVETLALAERT
jgi:tRNA/tmRNA/rRNA uracil-C5-methylase (TrmA/RlmC/RlmD family)